MRDYSSATIAALSARKIVARDFLWLKMRVLDTGLPFEYGFWSGIGNISASVVDITTGATVVRNFEGAGSLVKIGDVPFLSSGEAPSIEVAMSQVDENVNAIVRGYDLKQAGVEVYRILLSTETRLPVAAEKPRFFGFVDQVKILTPEEGGEGGISLSCVSHTQELLRSNADTRSYESQLMRDPSDDFYRDTVAVGDWEIFWGQKNGKIVA